ncbi:ATP-binding protein [Algoriphagus sp. D3-2-R+10]|uniref:ATP-binding protein n=1 Tax=Algoriphagus aurantiacus TaxID=3103948 RepID=UPI002B3E821A|nr:ATP-binding protein [Algoriphagus sp. D3-2-R+10]MEB2778219.1 ATP-binding protein [Algoriphagus sp. D3-2-R+10]
MKFNRLHFQNLSKNLDRKKVILLIGPRQVGKTTLVNDLLAGKDHLFLDGDDPTIRRLLYTPNTMQIKSILGNYKYVFVDEAQRIENIGLTAKIIHDQIPDVRLILSGSSSFELSGLTQEPLTGRKTTFHLYPISWKEFEQNVGYIAAEQDLPNRLVYGFYPEIITNVSDQETLLYELTESYLYKDVLALGIIKKQDVIFRLLQLLAFQMGSEVSYNELSRSLQVDVKTVISYIDLLEQAYVIYRMGTFSRNLRKEIKMNKKIYFYDNGVRNALIKNLQPLSLRNDIGALWENFLMAERLKYLEYEGVKVNRYFWRTKNQQELDYLEEKDGKLNAYEFKWNPDSKFSIPSSFRDTYEAEYSLIHRDNFRSFIG